MFRGNEVGFLTLPSSFFVQANVNSTSHGPSQRPIPFCFKQLDSAALPLVLSLHLHKAEALARRKAISLQILVSHAPHGAARCREQKFFDGHSYDVHS